MSGWGVTEGTLGTSKQTSNCYCKFLCLIHQNGAKLEFKYVGYFLFKKVNIGLEPTIAHSKASSEGAVREESRCFREEVNISRAD